MHSSLLAPPGVPAPSVAHALVARLVAPMQLPSPGSVAIGVTIGLAAILLVLGSFYGLELLTRDGPGDFASPSVYSEDEHARRRRAARHMAGHLLVAARYPACRDLVVLQAGIRRRWQPGDHALQIRLAEAVPPADVRLWSELVLALAGRVAETTGCRGFRRASRSLREASWALRRAESLVGLGWALGGDVADPETRLVGRRRRQAAAQLVRVAEESVRAFFWDEGLVGEIDELEAMLLEGQRIDQDVLEKTLPPAGHFALDASR